ncbi:MAG: GNAT family N-acetyltransferase [Candidatus Aenigmarchaeota archaeon]|nr:GNAT family N-acetyltransferase [Candidatus Aenigmarchaeota archaeon]
MKTNIFKPGQIIEEFAVEKDSRIMNVIFRTRKTSDYKDANKFINKLVKEKAYLIVITKQSLKQTKDWTISLTKEMKKRNTIPIVVMVNGSYKGSAEINKKRHGFSHVADIGIALDSSIRSSGIGTRLMNTLMKLAKENFKTEMVTLECLNGNRAISFYKRLGFKKYDILPKARKRGKTYDDGIFLYKFLK